MFWQEKNNTVKTRPIHALIEESLLQSFLQIQHSFVLEDLNSSNWNPDLIAVTNWVIRG